MKFSIIIFVIILSLVYAKIDLQNIEIPDIDDIAIIKERCESRGGKGTYDKVKAAKTEFQNCLQGLVDVEVLKNEVEEAKKTGSMDEVFGKCCNKRPKVKSCVASFTDTITPCLDDTEKNAMNLTLDVLRQLGEFICFRDGDRIAMFVAEGGVECLKNHVDGIQKCVNTTFKINTELNTNSLPTLLIDQKKCDDLNKLQTCVVEELEKCKDSTPANIIDALFRFIKRSACANKKNRRSLHHILKRSLNRLGLPYGTEVLKEEPFKKLREKCSVHGPPGAFDSVMIAHNYSQDCLQKEIRKTHLIAPSINDFKRIVAKCNKEWIAAAERCLPADEKYILQMRVDIRDSVLDFVNDNKFKILRNAAENPLMSLCTGYFLNTEVVERLIKCSPEGEGGEPLYVARDIQCQRMEQFTNCVNDEFNIGCKPDVEINEIKNELIAAVMAPCKKKSN